MKGYIKPPRLSTSFSRRAAQIKRRFENILDARAKRVGITAAAAAAVIMIISGGCLAARTEPIFLRSYYEYPSSEGGRIAMLKYITSRADNRRIESVAFPENPDVRFKIMGEQTRGYLYYSLHTVYVEAEASSEADITSARVEFSDGSAGDFDIGRFLIGSGAPVSGFLADSGVYGSSSGESGCTKLVKRDCTLIDITSDFTEDIGAKVSVSVNGAENYTLPMELHEGDFVSFTARISIDGGHRNDIFDIDKTLVLTDGEGNTSYDYLRNINYEPYLSERDIRLIVRNAAAP